MFLLTAAPLPVTPRATEAGLKVSLFSPRSEGSSLVAGTAVPGFVVAKKDVLSLILNHLSLLHICIFVSHKNGSSNVYL